MVYVCSACGQKCSIRPRPSAGDMVIHCPQHGDIAVVKDGVVSVITIQPEVKK